jgi:hypothetical protein
MVMGLSYLTCPWCPWSLSYSGCLLDLHVTSLILLLRIRMTWKTYRSEPGASQDQYMASWTKQLMRKQIHRPDRSLLDLSRRPRELKVEAVVACWPGGARCWELSQLESSMAPGTAGLGQPDLGLEEFVLELAAWRMSAQRWPGRWCAGHRGMPAQAERRGSLEMSAQA